MSGKQPKNGVCARCQKKPAEPGRKRCGACSAYARKHQAARESARKAAGVCKNCLERAIPNQAYCARHAGFYRNKYVKKNERGKT
jgi:hypothetical protein